ncbi:HET-domain-containing protein [Lentithecium fluviatile CBS 122367]|uniref:HET-domain-containing protein n=1 Tax=Lentithecium fluviatile CBS 122367 TaxID=1168545 RepID=A0A6G1IED3_9PLEO|nr:HET-domain-containing protein [Lentithecium fluviatile CBS 122367]
MPTLLRLNLEQFRHEIDRASLPLVFQDAIDYAKRAKLRYLWIDALCIIQDDEEDLSREISAMGNIYSNAHCNIVAAAAADRPVGLFAKGRLPHIPRPTIEFQRKDFSCHCQAFTRDTMSHNDIKLLRRGWVLQERLLSPRSIYFDDQLTWECSELVANEIFPEGLPGFREETPFKIQNLLKVNDIECPSCQVVHVERQMYDQWYKLVSTYMSCQLTYEDDTLPAISGLAKRFNKILNDEYLAGLWKQDLPLALLWFRKTSPKGKLKRTAPSWSWASTRWEIDHVFRLESPTIVAEIIEAKIEYQGADIYGKVTGGYLRMSGYLRPVKDTTSTWEMGCPSEFREWFDDGYSKRGKRSVKGAFYFLLAYRPATQVLSYCNPKKQKTVVWEPARSLGLILELVGDQTDTYRRIGAFAHPLGKHRSEEDAKFVSAFSSICTHCEVRREITII